MAETLRQLQERRATVEEYIAWAMPVGDDPSEDAEWVDRNEAAMALYHGWDMARRGHPVGGGFSSAEPLWAFQQGQNRVKRGPMVDVVKGGNYRVFWETTNGGWRPLEACPESPLCTVRCRWWPEKRRLLRLHWKGGGWGALDEGPFLLILAYARDHGRPTAVDLPRGSKIRVERGDGRVDDIDYYDGASLALELFAVATGKVDDGQVIRCGLPRMIESSPALFWSMLLNFIAAGTVAPFRSPVTFLDGEDSPIERELRAAEDSFLRHHQEFGNAPPGGPVTHESKSYFLHATMNRLVPIPPEVEETNLGNAITDCPRWWKATAKPWNELFARLLHSPNFVPCYFAATDLGCVAEHLGRPCNADHDPDFVAFVLDAITRPRSCLACGRYADKLRCSACKRYYCSMACSRADRSTHRERCLSFQASDAVALHPPPM
eukprot:CAMPEP_0118903722 /NCGR_PEP_ID=MMETSP1166-20130328/8477_1 /TAXON_ID=1104430 /ORGANISM="Chrysoreinhardia sp, Strain CCMP3193" /LENGTH=434 /DNA_ID=CAMNT_0006842957 /DNA_START=8 /DNA_END=1312 /DNA_ORIENTATION=+